MPSAISVGFAGGLQTLEGSQGGALFSAYNLPYGYKSLCMDTLGAFGTSLWSVIDRATDPNTHPKASGDYDPWRRPDPRREYVLSVAFANQIGDAIMIRGADARRRRNRSAGRYATGARA